MIKFELTDQEATLILQALFEQPAKLTMGLILKLQGQVKDQVNVKKDA